MTHICWCDTHETLTYLWIVQCQHFILATGLHRPWLDFSTPPKNRPSASVWTQKDWRSNPNCWLHKIQQMLSHCLFSFLWLLHFFFAVEPHWSSPSILPSVALTPHSLRALTIHPLTLIREGAEKQSRPWELPQTTGTTQRLDSDQLRVTKLQRL